MYKYLLFIALVALPANAAAAACPAMHIFMDSGAPTVIPGPGADCLGRSLAECRPVSVPVISADGESALFRLTLMDRICYFTLATKENTLSCSLDSLTSADGFNGRKQELSAAGKEPGLAAIRLWRAITVALGAESGNERLGCDAEESFE